MNHLFANETLSANDTFFENDMSEMDTEMLKLRNHAEQNRSIYADLCMTSLDKGSLEINFYTMAQVGFNVLNNVSSLSTTTANEWARWSAFATVKVTNPSRSNKKSECHYSIKDSECYSSNGCSMSYIQSELPDSEATEAVRAYRP